MKLYLYAKSGHNFGLENIRRISAIANILQECDPVVCSADYRAATFAKQYLGINKGVGVDVISNMPNVMERGDMFIYDDSGEASSTMQEYIKQFCKHSYKVGVDIPFSIVDSKYKPTNDTIYNKAVFFADDDYANWFYDLVQNGTKQDIPLLLGHYFFFGNEEKLEQFFSELLEEDQYEEVIKSTKYLLTSSVHTCLESLTCGNNPIYFKRDDKEEIQNFDLLEKYNIPTIIINDLKSFDQVMENFENIISDYPQLNKIEKVDITSIKDEINKTLKLFEHIMPSLEYK